MAHGASVLVFARKYDGLLVKRWVRLRDLAKVIEERLSRRNTEDSRHLTKEGGMARKESIGAGAPCGTDRPIEVCTHIDEHCAGRGMALNAPLQFLF